MENDLLLTAMVWISGACFPVLMLLTVFLYFAKRGGKALLQSRPKLKRLYDKLVAIGPKEGWSGYLICALVFLWLFAMAAVIMTTIQAGNPYS